MSMLRLYMWSVDIDCDFLLECRLICMSVVLDALMGPRKGWYQLVYVDIFVKCSNIQLLMTAIKYVPQVIV